MISPKPKKKKSKKKKMGPDIIQPHDALTLFKLEWSHFNTTGSTLPGHYLKKMENIPFENLKETIDMYKKAFGEKGDSEMEEKFIKVKQYRK